MFEMLNTADVGRHRQIRIIYRKLLKLPRDRVNHKVSIYSCCIHSDSEHAV